MKTNVCSVRCPASLFQYHLWKVLGHFSEFLTEPHIDAFRSSGDACSLNYLSAQYSIEILAVGDEEWTDR